MQAEYVEINVNRSLHTYRHPKRLFTFTEYPGDASLHFYTNTLWDTTDWKKRLNWKAKWVEGGCVLLLGGGVVTQQWL